MIVTARQKQLETEVASLANDAKVLAEKSVAGALTDDESKRFDELVAQLNKANGDLETERTRSAAASQVMEIDTRFNQPAQDRLREQAIQDTSADPRAKAGDAAVLSPGERFVKSKELKQALERGGERPDMRHSPVDVVSFRHQSAQWKDGMTPDEVRAVIASGTAPGSALFPQVLPTIYRALEKPLVMRDVLLSLNTTSDTVTVMQESAFTNNAAEVGEATTNNTNTLAGGLKPQSDLTFTEVNYPVRWVAHYVEITRQMLEDLAFMRGYIDDRLLTGLARREDNQFLNGNGTAPNLTGLLLTSGIQTLDAAYFAGAPVKDAGFANENLNRLRRAKTKIMVTGDALASFIVLNPSDAEDLDTISDAQRQYLLGGPLQPANRRIWGLPVVESQNIAAKTALVGDGSMAAVVDRSQSRIYTADQHSDYFVRNLFVILAEERLALPVFRPIAFAKVTLA